MLIPSYSRLLIFCTVVTVLLACTGASYAAAIALWLFDDPPGASVALDSSGNHFDLTIGPGSAIVQGGKFGNSLDASASSDPEALGAFRYRVEPALNPGDHDWTLECWVKAKPSMSGDNRIWGISGVNYIDYGRDERIDKLQIANYFLGVGSWDWPTGNLKADSAFHHVAVVYDSKAREMRHYYDGVLQHKAACRWRAVEDGRQDSAACMPPSYPMLQVGMRDAIQQWDERELNASNRLMKKFDGYIDEMRFSDKALYKANFIPPHSFAKPFLGVYPQELSFVASTGKRGKLSQRLTVSSGMKQIKWKATSFARWLAVSPLTGGQIQVTVDTSTLKPGSYFTELKCTAQNAANSPVRVPVRLAIVAPSAIRNVGDRKQLFMDKRFIEKSRNITLRLNQAENVELSFDTRDMPLGPSSIIRVPETGKYRIYYGAFARSCLCYTESTDGLHWSMPEGATDNTIIATNGNSAPFNLAMDGAVLLDPRDVPERRYKAFASRQSADPKVAGVYAFSSADGLKFTEVGRVLPMLPEGPVSPYWDERIGKYVVYMRVQNSKKPVKMVQGSQFFYHPNGTVSAVPQGQQTPAYENLRSMGRIETNDLLKPWPYDSTQPASPYTTAVHIPMVLTADKKDGFVDFYNAAPFIYPYAEDVYLAFPAAFRHFHPSRQPWFYKFADANGPIEVQLAVSRDGIHWQRDDRSPYVGMGTTNEWNRWLNMMGVGMIRDGDYLYQFYWGSTRLHDSIYLRPEQEKLPVKGMKSGIGAVRQRLDGFISADADISGGSITTPPIIFSGNILQINHNSGALGTIFVEIRDLNDRPIPGYSLADCEEITGNDVAWEVRWRGKSDLSSLTGKPVKLHFAMCRTKLYAFQFVR